MAAALSLPLVAAVALDEPVYWLPCSSAKLENAVRGGLAGGGGGAASARARRGLATSLCEPLRFARALAAALAASAARCRFARTAETAASKPRSSAAPPPAPPSSAALGAAPAALLPPPGSAAA